MQIPSRRSVLLFSAGVTLLCMLGFYSLLCAAPPGGKPPFEDAVEQREAMLRELREIKELIKEQNALLREALPPANGRDKATK
jgi:hypothetical protein